jgi:hypothetical protein
MISSYPVVTASAAGGGGSTPLFDHFTDVGTSSAAETDIYTDTLAAGQLANNGDKVFAEYAGINASDGGGATKRWRIYFGGTLIFDGTAVASTTADSFNFQVFCIRVDASTVRCTVQAAGNIDSKIGAFASYVAVTGLTLSNTQILKITATPSAATANLMVGKMGSVWYVPRV